jgi:tetratricopeptide (TPR) repeat protein
MSIRFRRSIKLGAGVRLNLTKTGIGLSVGGRGHRISVHSSGRSTRTLGIPGTGLSYMSIKGSGRRSSGRRATGTGRTQRLVAVPIDIPRALPRPGFLAGDAERDFYRGVQAYLGASYLEARDAFLACLGRDPGALSAHLFAAVTGQRAGDPASFVIEHLEAVVRDDRDLPDAYEAKYLPANMVAIELAVPITDHVVAHASFDTVGATLALAEQYQAAGRLDDAIGLIHQLHEASPDDPLARLSLADLLYADGDHDGVLEATSTATNDSDIGVAQLHLRAAALFASGHPDGSLAVFRQALAKTTGRDPDLLKIVRYDRALAFEAAGQHSKALEDLEKLYAADPAFEDVRARLAVP